MARVLIPGLPNHVTQRGNRRQQTFFGEDDDSAYLELMAEWCTRHQNLPETEIKQKEIRAAIPPSLRYRPTKAQLGVLDEIRRLTEKKGIQLTIKELGG